MITSIYLTDHDHLINEPQTINFGGKYLYSYIPKGDLLLIERRINEKYIDGFFNISESKCEITLVSAVVGQNGAGKSSLLDIIRSAFFKNMYSMPYTILVEVNGDTKVLKSEFHTIQMIDIFGDDKNPVTIDKIDTEDFQSIYYSPYFDLKYNEDFSETDKYNISLDEYIMLDLKDTDKKGTGENGWQFDPHEELIFKNNLRQVEFMMSNVFKQDKEINAFELPHYKNVKLFFRDIQINNDFWNTPNQFRTIIKNIKDKTEKEIDNWHLIRNFDENHRVTNQAQINQYILKRFIINAILSVIIRMMEEKNTFLNEGFVDQEDFPEEERLNAEQLFLEFIDKSYIKISDQKRKIFDSNVYNKFFEELDKVLAKDLGDDSKTRSIDVGLQDVEEILFLHRKIVKDFFNYYTHYEEFPRQNLNLYEFIGVKADINLSSGQLAMLNFFSRLYYFIENNLTGNNPALSIKKNYILLLDEADLGFHPLWKKKYINTILKTIPYFFEYLTVIPKLQIIITTHDALTLSDLPSNNVIFLKKSKGYLSVVSNDDQDRIQKTFGANITDLLAHSFFIEDGLIGDFSKIKIREVINWINKSKKLSDSKKSTKKFKRELEYHKRIIKIIDEKIVKIKLTEMITELVPDDKYYNHIIDSEISYLESKKR